MSIAAGTEPIAGHGESSAPRVGRGLMTLGAAAFVGYAYGFDTIGHLELIYLATAIFVVGALLALRGLTGRRA